MSLGGTVAVAWCCVLAGLGSAAAGTLDDAARDSVEVNVLIHNDDFDPLHLDLYGGGFRAFLASNTVLSQEFNKLLRYLQTSNLIPQLVPLIPYIITGNGLEQMHMKQFLEILGLNPLGTYGALDLNTALKELIIQTQLSKINLMNAGISGGGAVLGAGGIKGVGGIMGGGGVMSGGDVMSGGGVMGGGGTVISSGSQYTLQGGGGVIPLNVIPHSSGGTSSVEISVQNIGKPQSVIPYPVANQVDISGMLQQLQFSQNMYDTQQQELMQLQQDFDNVAAANSVAETVNAAVQDSATAGVADCVPTAVEVPIPVPYTVPVQVQVPLPVPVATPSACVGTTGSSMWTGASGSGTWDGMYGGWGGGYGGGVGGGWGPWRGLGGSGAWGAGVMGAGSCFPCMSCLPTPTTGLMGVQGPGALWGAGMPSMSWGAGYGYCPYTSSVPVAATTASEVVVSA